MIGAAPFLHPRERTLHRYADGMLPRSEHARLVAHLAECARCRSRVGFARELAAAVRQLPAPALDDALVERVLAERAGGARAILPTAAAVAARRRAVPHGLATLGVTLAAGVTIFFAGRVAIRALHEPLGGPPPAAPRAVNVPLRDRPGLFTSVTGRHGFPTEPLPPVRPHPDLVRPVRATYEILHLTREGVPRAPEGRSALEVMPVVVDGVLAWRVVRTLRPGGSSTGTWRLHSETAYVARADLRLIGRTEHVRPYGEHAAITIRQRLVGDSLVGWMKLGDRPARPLRHALPRATAPYLSDAALPLLFLALPLDGSVSGSASLLRWAVYDDDVLSRVALRVTGEERVNAPAGTFDCWRITMTLDGRTVVHWVRKSDGLGVRVSEPGREVLLASDRPTPVPLTRP